MGNHGSSRPGVFGCTVSEMFDRVPADKFGFIVGVVGLAAFVLAIPMNIIANMISPRGSCLGVLSHRLNVRSMVFRTFNINH